MTNLLQTGFFQLIHGKINQKTWEIIKKLKNNFLIRPVKIFRKFFKGPIDLGQDHAIF